MRTARGLVMALAVVAAAAVLAYVLDRRAPDISGSVRVIDGDSLVIGGAEMRLFGIDAPEYRQTCTRDGETWPCGMDAARALRAAVAGKTVVCKPRDEDRYGRTVAVCSVGEEDLSAAMVWLGLAVAYGAYQSEERAARDARRGLWSSSFETPSLWRARHPRPPK